VGLGPPGPRRAREHGRAGGRPGTRTVSRLGRTPPGPPGGALGQGRAEGRQGTRTVARLGRTPSGPPGGPWGRAGPEAGKVVASYHEGVGPRLGSGGPGAGPGQRPVRQPRHGPEPSVSTTTRKPARHARRKDKVTAAASEGKTPRISEASGDTTTPQEEVMAGTTAGPRATRFDQGRLRRWRTGQPTASTPRDVTRTPTAREPGALAGELTACEPLGTERWELTACAPWGN